MNIAITGHRPNKLGNDYDLTSELIKKIKFQIQSIITKYNDIGRDNWTPLTLITGMALGIDTLFAQIAIENKIPFIAAIPMKGQEKMWPEKSQDVYHECLKRARHIHIVDIDKNVAYSDFLQLPFGLYSAFKMNRRNEWMIDNCDKLIAVWDGTSGGTTNCVRYAKKMGKFSEDLHINPNNYK